MTVPHPTRHPGGGIPPGAPPIQAVLLLGPTGSGKTPQGRLLERSGYGYHFDFGHELRAAAKGGVLGPKDTSFIRRLLEAHALLPDDRFDIAEALLCAFLCSVRSEAKQRRLILNGLPRHVAQARDMDAYVDVKHVVVLECDAETARLRVSRRREGKGSDHADRDDDHAQAIEEKLRIYERQTRPLMEFYGQRPATKVIRVQVKRGMTDEAIHREVTERLAQTDHALMPPTDSQESKIGN